jgi:RNA polymerase sigma-70 factor (ECF subfamily)
MDEIQLIDYARRGDLDAFNRLVLTYQETVFNVAARILCDDALAEDAAQTAFINAYRNLKSFRGGSFRAWLLRTVTNACYDELRRQKRRPTTPLEPFNEDGNDEVESPSWLADNAPSPENVLINKEIGRAVQDCLKRLPDDFRTVVVMVDLEKCDYLEVATATGKPLGTVKSRLARARLKLRDCLQNLVELLPVNNRLLNEDKA